MITDVVDLSFPIHEDMPTDDLGPKFWTRLGHAYTRQIYQNTQSRAGRVFFMTDHIGTHLDGPLRFDPKGMAVEELALEDVILPARVFDLRHVGRGGEIGPDELEAAGVKVAEREAAVLWTGHDLHYDSPDYFWNRPRLSTVGAEWLVAKRARMVAADFPGIGAPNDDRYEVKRILHRGGALTVELLCNLDKVEGRAWTLAAAPLRIRGGTGSPLRAAALVGPPPARLIDLTLDIYKEMPSLGAVPTYWSRATHAITEHFYKGELSYQTTALFLSEHAGTHFDVPYHFDPAGRAME
ncbi:MAG: cyclase family protein, partial [Rhodospirillales bacterium]|nr:cyclase family protein [Rhodospirillales bacterium]